MKFLLLLSLLLPATLQAEQSPWMVVRPDHLNLLYSAGEHAMFQLQVSNQPINPEYGVYVTVQKVGEGSPANVALMNGLGTFTTEVLAGGAPQYEIVAHFTGPGTETDPAFDEVVQDEIIQLQVNQ